MAYHYIVECIAYLPVPGGMFPTFFMPFSFPYSTATPLMESLEGAHAYVYFLGEPYIGLGQYS